MKTPMQLISETKIVFTSMAIEQAFYRVIEEAQKEAYNEALEDSVKNAKGFYTFNQRIYRDDWYLDKDSILSLKKK
jgi:hypothetical protein